MSYKKIDFTKENCDCKNFVKRCNSFCLTCPYDTYDAVSFKCDGCREYFSRNKVVFFFLEDNCKYVPGVSGIVCKECLNKHNKMIDDENSFMTLDNCVECDNLVSVAYLEVIDGQLYCKNCVEII